MENDTFKAMFITSGLALVLQISALNFHFMHCCSDCALHIPLKPNLIWTTVYHMRLQGLTHSPPTTTKVPYANSMDLDETPSNSASHPDPSCLTLRQHVQKLPSNIEEL